METTDKKVNPFWGNIFKSLYNADELNLFKILKRIPLFKDLSKRELRKVANILHERNYQVNEYVFQMHQPGAAMFIIKTGKIKILYESDTEDDIELAVLGEGDFLGELALLDNSPRSASAMAMEKTEMLAIFRADLDKLLMTEPGIGAKIIRQLAVVIGLRLKATNEQLSKINTEAARENV